MPGGDPQVPDLMKIIKSLQKDIRALQRTHESEGPRNLGEDRAVFSHPGSPVVMSVSPAFIYRRPSGYLTSVIVTARIPGSTDSTVVVSRWDNKNDTDHDLVSITLEVGDKYTIVDDLMLDFDDLDQAMVSVIELGEGAADFTVVLEFIEGSVD